MFDCEAMNNTIENIGIAGALAMLIEKNRTTAVELEALALLVESEIDAGQKREAEQAARLGEALGELAEAKAAVKIETQGRVEAERVAAELRTGLDQVQAILAQLPMVGTPRAPELLATDEEATTAGEISAAARNSGPADMAATSEALDAIPTSEASELKPVEAVGDAAAPITIELDAKEASALEDIAIQQGFPDGAAYLVHLVRLQLDRRNRSNPVRDGTRSGRKSRP